SACPPTAFGRQLTTPRATPGRARRRMRPPAPESRIPGESTDPNRGVPGRTSRSLRFGLRRAAFPARQGERQFKPPVVIHAHRPPLGQNRGFGARRPPVNLEVSWRPSRFPLRSPRGANTPLDSPARGTPPRVPPQSPL